MAEENPRKQINGIRTHLSRIVLVKLLRAPVLLLPLLSLLIFLGIWEEEGGRDRIIAWKITPAAAPTCLIEEATATTIAPHTQISA
jgi:hypothetical protein